MKWGSGTFGVGQEQVLGEAYFTSCPCPGGQCCPSTQPQSMSPPQDHSHQGRARALQLLCSHCHFSLQQLSCYFSPAKSPPDSAPCQEEPAQLPTFYCFCFTAHGWADEIFSAHAPQTRGRRGQPGKSCLKAFQPCLPTLPCCRSALVSHSFFATHLL